MGLIGRFISWLGYSLLPLAVLKKLLRRGFSWAGVHRQNPPPPSAPTNVRTKTLRQPPMVVKLTLPTQGASQYIFIFLTRVLHSSDGLSSWVVIVALKGTLRVVEKNDFCARKFCTRKKKCRENFLCEDLLCASRNYSARYFSLRSSRTTRLRAV